MFRGVNPLNLDAKGRLAMPVKYRDRLQESCRGQLVLTVDRDRCLLVYPLPEWEEIERKLVKLPSFNERSPAATLPGGAGRVEKRGRSRPERFRVRLPQPLC